MLDRKLDLQNRNLFLAAFDTSGVPYTNQQSYK